MGEQTSTDAAQNQPLNWLQLEDPKAVEFITDPSQREMLIPFFKHPKGVSEAAKEVKESFRKMYYLTTKAVNLGLLEVADTQQRKGRAIKRYRCTADVFFVPYSKISESLRVTWQEAQLNLLQNQLDAAVHSHPFKSEDVLDNNEWGRAYKIDGPQEQQLSAFVSSNKRRFMSQAEYHDYLAWEHPKPFFSVVITNFGLSSEDAKEWHRELLALYHKYLEREGEGPKHHVKLFLAQMPEDE